MIKALAKQDNEKMIREISVYCYVMKVYFDELAWDKWLGFLINEKNI